MDYFLKWDCNLMLNLGYWLGGAGFNQPHVRETNNINKPAQPSAATSNGYFLNGMRNLMLNLVIGWVGGGV
jgi:hypothetical protein